MRGSGICRRHSIGIQDQRATSELYAAIEPYKMYLQPVPIGSPGLAAMGGRTLSRARCCGRASNSGAIRTGGVELRTMPRLCDLALEAGGQGAAVGPHGCSLDFEDAPTAFIRCAERRRPVVAAIRSDARAGDPVRLRRQAAQPSSDRSGALEPRRLPNSNAASFAAISWIWGPPEDHLGKVVLPRSAPADHVYGT